MFVSFGWVLVNEGGFEIRGPIRVWDRALTDEELMAATAPDEAHASEEAPSSRHRD